MIFVKLKQKDKINGIYKKTMSEKGINK